MRKFVTPAHEGALIPNPSRGGFLPPGGANVEWDHHWERHARQGNVKVSAEKVHPDATGPKPPPDPAPAAAPLPADKPAKLK